MDEQHNYLTRSPLVWILPLILLVDLILGGPYGLAAKVSGRHILFVLSAAILAWRAVQSGSVHRTHLLPVTLILLFIVLNVMWASIIPFVNEGNLLFAFRDAYAFLLLVLPLLVVVQKERLIDVVALMKKVVVVAALLVASAQIVIWVTAVEMQNPSQVSLAIKTFFVAKGRADSIFVGEMDGIYRVLWVSSLWHLLGFFWIKDVFKSLPAKLSAYPLFALAIFFSYTRGLWIALLLGIILLIALASLSSKTFRAPFKDVDLIAMLLVLLGFVAAFAVSDEVKFRALAMFSWETGVVDNVVDNLDAATFSVQERLRQVPYLMEKWREHPIFGNGYGAYAENYTRDRQVPYSYENIPVMMLMKLGAVGMVLFSTFFAVVILTALRQKAAKRSEVIHFVAALVALLLLSMTNPYLMNFVGMGALACLLVQWVSFFATPEGIH